MLRKDDWEPRHSQLFLHIFLVACALILGGGWLRSDHVFLMIASVGALHLLFRKFRLVSENSLEWESLMLSCLGLCLLLRTQSLVLLVVAALLLVGSHYLFRFKSKLLVNPLAFTLATMLLYSGGTKKVWLSSMQWASPEIVLGSVALLGLLFARGVKRLDTALSFGMAYALLLAGRSFVLGASLGSTLDGVNLAGMMFFSFFVLIDPLSTPNSRAGRMIYSAFLAWVLYSFQFISQLEHSEFLALTLVGLINPLMDQMFPARAFRWPRYQLKLEKAK